MGYNMKKIAGKTALCAMSAALFFVSSGMSAGATGLSSILPAAGMGLELEEGQSVKIVKEEAINKVKQNKEAAGESVSDNEVTMFENASITLDKEIVEPIDTKALLEAAAKKDAEAEEELFKTLVIAQVNDYVNVRDIPSEDGEIVGKLYDESVGYFIEEENGWYQISSGSCMGYVKAEYCVTGEDAIELAREVGVRIATVTTTTLKVREEPSLEATVLGLVPIEDELVVTEELDDWVKVDIEEGFGYVSTDYVTLSTEFVEAESKAEEEARLEKERKAREEANAAAAKAEAARKSESTSAPVVTASGSGTGSSVANYALQFVGNPYVYGGTSLTNGADCSGFVMSVYANFGVSLPHSSAADRNVGYDVGGIGNAQPGDIVCYSGHVAIYIGNGQIVHASTSKTGIIVSNATYRQPLCVRRIF